MTRALLLDVNVLVALTHEAHVHHGVAQAWLRRQSPLAWASCSVTQLGFVRLAAMPAVGGPEASPRGALALLDEMLQHPGHVFWPDRQGLAGAACLRSPLVVGHRQVTDAYLLGMAVQQRSALVTLDRGLLALAEAQQVAAHLHWIGPEGGHAAHEPSGRYRPSGTSSKARSRYSASSASRGES